MFWDMMMLGQQFDPIIFVPFKVDIEEILMHCYRHGYTYLTLTCIVSVCYLIIFSYILYPATTIIQLPFDTLYHILSSPV